MKWQFVILHLQQLLHHKDIYPVVHKPAVGCHG